jgi:hypothetical protein
MRLPSPSRASGGVILRFLIILGLVAYTGFFALKLTKQVPMTSVSSVAAPDASLASDVLDNQTHLLNLPQGVAPATVPAPPGDQPPAAQQADSNQDAPDSGVDTPSPDQPQNIIRTVPAAPADDAGSDTNDSAPGASADSAAPAAPDASAGAPVVPIGPNAPSAQPDGGAPGVPTDPSRVPADSAHKDQLRQFLHDSLQRALHNPQQ